MSAVHVLDALMRLEGMAIAGLPPDDVAHEAELIAARWWAGRGDLEPERLVPLVQELRRWCVVASGEAARWAGALDRAQRALTVYA